MAKKNARRGLCTNSYGCDNPAYDDGGLCTICRRRPCDGCAIELQPEDLHIAKDGDSELCAACLVRDEAKAPRRGPGRPPLTPGGGVTSAHRIRLGQSHQEELARLVMDGVAGNASEAIRYLIEKSAKARR